MFEVLAFVYENYGRGSVRPEDGQLGRRLSAHGFHPDRIVEALQWLDGLRFATQGLRAALRGRRVRMQEVWLPSPDVLRVYLAIEQDRLGAGCLGFLHVLEAGGRLHAGVGEIAIERAMAVPGRPVSLDEFMTILRMVHWCAGIEADEGALHALCHHRAEYRPH